MLSIVRRYKAAWLPGIVLLLSGIVIFLAAHQVPTGVTQEDREALQAILQGVDVSREHEGDGFESQLKLVEAVQERVLQIAPGNEGIPFGSSREPADLLQRQSGLCYDRSRVIEKALRYLGFEVRHVSIYSLKGETGALKALLTPGVPSHAVSEVLTSRGWMVVDSNDPWVSVDAQGNPHSARVIAKAAVEGRKIDWIRPPNRIYLEPFIPVIGLYSRHGHFYPPYDGVPDVNYAELIQNLD